MSKIEITPDTIIAELIKAYPDLEEKLIEIAPVFVRLKNPILKRTIARVTSLRQAAIIAKIPLANLINKLRETVGENEIFAGKETNSFDTLRPDWAKEENVIIRYDAREDLENGIHPVAQVLKETEKLEKENVYLLITPFLPLPLIDRLKEKGMEIYSVKLNDDVIYNFIKKPDLKFE